MKFRSSAAFIAISALVVLTILASTAQDVSRQADGTATTTQANPVPLIRPVDLFGVNPPRIGVPRLFGNAHSGLDVARTSRNQHNSPASWRVG